MPLKKLTSNELVGHMSAQQFSLALNSYGVHLPIGVDGTTSLGSVKAWMPSSRLRVVARASEDYGAAETTALILRYQGAAGANIDQAIVTLSVANVPAAGEFVVFDGEINRIPVGSVIQLNVDYTAGTPNDPAISLTLELY